jgi:hypothetical protein
VLGIGTKHFNAFFVITNKFVLIIMCTKGTDKMVYIYMHKFHPLFLVLNYMFPACRPYFVQAACITQMADQARTRLAT